MADQIETCECSHRARIAELESLLARENTAICELMEEKAELMFHLGQTIADRDIAQRRVARLEVDLVGRSKYSIDAFNALDQLSRAVSKAYTDQDRFDTPLEALSRLGIDLVARLIR